MAGTLRPPLWGSFMAWLVRQDMATYGTAGAPRALPSLGGLPHGLSSMTNNAKSWQFEAMIIYFW